MKRILLTSTALVAFAGAAAAEVSFGGDAKIGFNDDVKNGFYWSVGMTAKAEAELNSGLVAGFTLDVDIKEGAEGTYDDLDIRASDYVLYLKSDNAGLYFGDTKTATESLWKGADSHFLNRDFWDDAGYALPTFAQKDGDAVLRGEGTFGNVTAAVSATVFNANGGTDEGKHDIGAYEAAAKYEMGAYTVIGAVSLKDEDQGVMDTTFGLTGMASVAGADVTATFITSGDYYTSYGAEVSYPFGPVTLGGHVIAENFDRAGTSSDEEFLRYGVKATYANGPIKATAFYDAVDFDDNNADFAVYGVEGSYDMSNGLKLNAGVISSDLDGRDTAFYAGGEYDMGNGAKLMASYADAGDAGKSIYDLNKGRDAIGAPEYMDGATIALSFKF